MIWASFVIFLQYLFYLRFDIGILLLFIGFIVVSRPGGKAAAFFGGMYELTARRAAVVSLVAAMVAWSLATTGSLTILHAPERFGIPKAWPAWELIWKVLSVAPVAYLLALVGRENGNWVALVLPSTALSFVAFMLTAASSYWPYVFLPTWTQLGFQDGYGFGGLLASGHIAALAVAILCKAIYVVMGLLTGRAIKNGKSVPSDKVPELGVPALAWVLSLFVLLAWSLPALAFFLDYYPFPVFVVIALVLVPVMILLDKVYCKVTGNPWIEPHTFHIYPLAPQQPERAVATPASLMRPRKKAIVVCAEGGGIFAAAWAARVLEQMGSIGGFRDSVVATSTVSGGSVGCFYFLASYGKPVGAGELFRQASGSSLDQVSWGFAFRDLVRFFLPIGSIFKWGDRAWALQRAWCRFSDWDEKDSGKSYLLESMLSQWQSRCAAGQMPAAIFNTTIVETGERLAIATAALTKSPTALEFRERLPDCDMRVATAVGLSAAFPYVSPAAAAWSDEMVVPRDRRRHIVDGGYYDNYGVVSAVEFVDGGLSELDEANRPEVLILRIEGTPEAPREPAGVDGFTFQLWAPLKALLYMRGASQASRNDTEVGMLMDRWNIGCDVSGRQLVSQLQLRFPAKQGYQPPVTWHLTADDKKELLSVDISEALGQVRSFLK